MNVILISIDTLRYDCVGYQPDKRGLERYNLLRYLETPTLDRLAEKSLCFTHCFSTNTYTTSAHASLFTGLYPPRHGIREFYSTKLSGSVKTLAERFKKNGYETVMATDSPVLFEPLDLSRGFNHVFKKDDQGLFRFLRESADKDIFLFVHFFDVHAPYLFSMVPPGKHYNADYYLEMDLLYKKLGRQKTSDDPSVIWHRIAEDMDCNIDIFFPLYVRGVSKFDKGRFNYFIRELTSLGYLQDSLTAVLSDHGEGTCSHGTERFKHAGDLYDDVVRVPLMIKHPDMSHKVSDNLISIVDIFSTLLKMSGIKDDENDGIYMGGRRDTVYFETWLSSLTMDNPESGLEESYGAEWLLRQRGVHSENMKYIMTGAADKQFDSILSRKAFRKLMNYNKYLPSGLKKFITDRVLGGGDTPRICDLSNKEFVKLLYRKVLSRFEDRDGFEYYVNALDARNNSREQLLFIFLLSQECGDNPMHKVYDLKKDPFELQPRSISSIKRMAGDLPRYYDYILQMEASSVRTGSIWERKGKAGGAEGEASRKTIMKNLRDLGYM